MDIVDRAKSILLSNHHVDRANLKVLASTIANGEEPYFPEDALNEYIVLFESELIGNPNQLRKPKWYSTVLSILGVLAIPAVVFILMPLGFSLGERLFGISAKPSAPIAVGIVKELELTDADSSPWIGRKVIVHSGYLQFDSDSLTTLIPRERVKRIEITEK